MRRLFTFLTIPLLLLTAFGCETVENPVSEIPEIETTTGVIHGKVQPNVDGTIKVRLLKDGKVVAQMESTGGFTLRKIEAGNYTLRISARGFQEMEFNVNVIAGETVTLDTITLEELSYPVSHIIGLVRNNRTGIRLPEIRVQLTDQDGKQDETITSDEGIFNFDNLPTQQKFTLTIEAADYEVYDLSVKPLDANETEKLNVKLSPIGIGDREVEPEEPGEGLPIFSKAPEFELPDGNGKLHSLYDTLDEGKNAIVVFYIGGA